MEWISVNESLPERREGLTGPNDESDYVIAYSEKFDKYSVSRYCYYFESWEYRDGMDQLLNEITHWMPLPEKP